MHCDFNWSRVSCNCFKPQSMYYDIKFKCILLLFSQIKTSNLIWLIIGPSKAVLDRQKTYWTEKSNAYFNQQTKRKTKISKQVLAFWMKGLL